MSEAESAAAFRHKPYAEGARPFSIGLRPMDAREWIEIDGRLAHDLDSKQRILDSEGEEAFAELPGSEDPQAETLERLVAHLSARFPHVFRIEGESLRVGERLVALAEGPPLRAASLLVQEDLLLMQRFDDGWRLTAGSLCFPSTWRLPEKLGRPMPAIHAPVPGFAGSMNQRIERIFDALRVGEPVERRNVSFYGDEELRHAESRAPADKFPADVPILERAHVRVERQTLVKLPRTGALVFTVRTYIDAIRALASRPDGAALAKALSAHVAAMEPEQLAYKGLASARNRLIEALDTLAAA